MKTGLFRILGLFVALTPIFSSAQTNVSKAFDNLLKSSDVVYTEMHSIDKDVTTGLKESQYDIYRFTLPAKKMSLVDNVVKALKADESEAYSFYSGLAGPSDQIIYVAIGNGDTSAQISSPGRNYAYAAFMAPKKEDPSGKYRYVYGINWFKTGDKIEGELIITYATTLKYRQEAANKSQLKYFTTTTRSDADNSADSWFTTFMGYVQALSTDNVAARQALATKIYKQTQSSQISSVSNEDKDTAREILKTLISNTKYDHITSKLLNQALVNLK